jgi:hypothetical protein
LVKRDTTAAKSVVPFRNYECYCACYRTVCSGFTEILIPGLNSIRYDFVAPLSAICVNLEVCTVYLCAYQTADAR